MMTVLVVPVCSGLALEHCLPVAPILVGMQVCVPGLEERARKFQPLAVESSLSPGQECNTWYQQNS